MALDRATVDSKVAEVSEQLLRAVLALDELEEVGRVVDELMFGDEYETSIGKANTHGSPGLATNEDIVRQQTEQEGDVGLAYIRKCSQTQTPLTHLDTTNTELDERTQHLPTRHFVRRAADRALDKQTVVVRRDLRTREARARVKADTVATSTAVDLDLARVRLEVLRRVLGGNAALDSETTLGDGVLGQTELREGRASSDLDLRGDDVDASDLLCEEISSMMQYRVLSYLPVMVCST